MEDIKDLRDLLLYQVQCLYSAEEQMEEILPRIIEKANHSSLKNALQHHLNITKVQKKRLERIPQMVNDELGGGAKSSWSAPVKSIKEGGMLCKGMKGLVDEANELLMQGLSKEVNDAALIICVQKMEHYEIATYGTALAYAEQLHLHAVELLLQETLDEEYDADDIFTSLAVASYNKEAEPEVLKTNPKKVAKEAENAGRPLNTQGIVHITERSIKSPGGRAGTSHRRYPNGESRGH